MTSAARENLDFDELAREHAAPLIAVLTRLFGPHNLELAEDVVQDAFVRAIEAWTRDGLPDEPRAWLLRVARNKAIDSIRRERGRLQFASDLETLLAGEFTMATVVDREFSEERVRDDLLRMIFMCCASSLPPESSLPLILKTLCGLQVPAIARAMLLSEDAVRKRLTRARESVRGVPFAFPDSDARRPALRTTRHVLYLLFNEGYLSSQDDAPLRPELCRDAMRLTKLLVDEATIADGATTAMLALMCLHAARIPARVDESGKLLGLDEQDRTLWNRRMIDVGLDLLQRSSRMGDRRATRFHLEAAIAARHCNAGRFEDTNWTSICSLYERWLELDDASPMIALNHAVALSYRDGADSVLPRVEAMQSDPRLARSAALPATLATLYRRAGRDADADAMQRRARENATAHEHELLRRQLERTTPEIT